MLVVNRKFVILTKLQIKLKRAIYLLSQTKKNKTKILRRNNNNFILSSSSFKFYLYIFPSYRWISLPFTT